MESYITNKCGFLYLSATCCEGKKHVKYLKREWTDDVLRFFVYTRK